MRLFLECYISIKVLNIFLFYSLHNHLSLNLYFTTILSCYSNDKANLIDF